MRRPAVAAAAVVFLALAAPHLLAQEAAKPPDPKGADPKEARLAAYDRGLDFLRSRAKDGSWGFQGKANPGVSALATTAFLDRPGGVAAKDKAVVDAALAYLLSLQKPDGGIYDGGDANYVTSVSIQAFALSGRKDCREAMEKAVAYVRKMQYCEAGTEGLAVPKADLRYGGMGYGTGDEVGNADLSNTQFALESLRAAGVPETDPAFQRALVFLKRLQNRKENESAGEQTEKKGEDGKTYVRSTDGGSVYRPFESKAGGFARPDGKLELRSYGSMTYALLKCYIYAGLKPEDQAVKDAVQWIRDHYTWEENPGFPEPKLAQQGLYYYFATAARALEMLGEDAAGKGPDGKPRDWRADLASRLLSLQKGDGSWVNPNGRWEEGLPEISTAFALKALGRTTR
jgi:squalene-hopene/tetraprenyl-beta-curcumene cyclase